MIERVVIDGFRGFQHFEMEGLGRINLLVGPNNSGKTTLLEALALGLSKQPFAFSWIVSERLSIHSDELLNKDRIPVRDFFYGRSPSPGSRFCIHILDERDERKVTAEIDIRAVSTANSATTRQGIIAQTLQLRYVMPGGLPLELPLDSELTVPNGPLLTTLYSTHTGRPVNMLPFSGSNPAQTAQDLGTVLLTPEEAHVLDALRLIDPAIERIAFVPGRERTRAGIVLQLRDVPQRAGLDSMGDGMWRLLNLILCLVGVEGGVLLIDEIDIGLHYSVLPDMWRMVRTTAERLNVQVFATTHSRDCYQSLATIASREVSEGSTVTIHRIEKGRDRSILYTEQMIVAAAEHDIEVR